MTQLLIMDDGSHVMYQGVAQPGWEQYYPKPGDVLMTITGLPEKPGMDVPFIERTVVEVPELWPDG